MTALAHDARFPMLAYKAIVLADECYTVQYSSYIGRAVPGLAAMIRVASGTMNATDAAEWVSPLYYVTMH
jgi:hypothetical protein